MEKETIIHELLKFIYSEKATKFFEVITLLLSYVVPVKSKVKISQNFVALLRIYELYNGARTEIQNFFLFISGGWLLWSTRLIDG